MMVQRADQLGADDAEVTQTIDRWAEARGNVMAAEPGDVGGEVVSSLLQLGGSVAPVVAARMEHWADAAQKAVRAGGVLAQLTAAVIGGRGNAHCNQPPCFPGPTHEGMRHT